MARRVLTGNMAFRQWWRNLIALASILIAWSLHSDVIAQVDIDSVAPFKLHILLDSSNNMRDGGNIQNLAAGEIAREIRKLISGDQDNYHALPSDSRVIVEVFGTKSDGRILKESRFSHRVGHGPASYEKLTPECERIGSFLNSVRDNSDLSIIQKNVAWPSAERPNTIVLGFSDRASTVDELDKSSLLAIDRVNSAIRWVELPQAANFAGKNSDLHSQVERSVVEVFKMLRENKFKRKINWTIKGANKKMEISRSKPETKLIFRVENDSGQNLKHVACKVENIYGAKRYSITGGNISGLAAGASAESNITIRFQDIKPDAKTIGVKFFIAIPTKKRPPLNEINQKLTFKLLEDKNKPAIPKKEVAAPIQSEPDAEVTWLQAEQREIELSDKLTGDQVSFTVPDLVKIIKRGKGAVNLKITGYDNPDLFEACLFEKGSRNSRSVENAEGVYDLKVILRERFYGEEAAINIAVEAIGGCVLKADEPRISLKVKGIPIRITDFTQNELIIDQKGESKLPIDLSDIVKPITLRLSLPDGSDDFLDTKSIQVKPGAKTRPSIKWSPDKYPAEFPLSLTITSESPEVELRLLDQLSSPSLKLGVTSDLRAPLPMAKFMVVPQAEDNSAPLTVNCDNLSENAVKYEWDFGNGETSKGENPRVTYTQAGSFDITLTAINSDNQKDTFTQAVVVKESPPPQAKFDVRQTKNDMEREFVNQSVNGKRFEWRFGDQQLSYEKNPIHNYGKAGEYEVSLKVFNATGKFSETERKVVIEASDFPWLLIVAAIIAIIVAAVLIMFLSGGKHLIEVTFYRNGKEEARIQTKGKKALNFRETFQSETPLKMFVVYDQEDEQLNVEFIAVENETLVNKLNNAKIQLKANVRSTSMPLGDYKILDREEGFSVKESSDEE